MVALLTIPLIVILAFTADFGLAYANRQAISTGADSAALAIVHNQYRAQLKSPSRTCAQALAADAALPTGSSAKATTIALAQVNANAPAHTTFTAADIDVSLSCESSNKVLQASVTVRRNVPRAFSLVIGSDPLRVRRTSVSALGVRNGVDGVEPIGLCKLQAQKIVDDAAADLSDNKPYRAELISLSKVWSGNGTCDGAGGSGNWGWLDLGQGNGNSALAAMITTGSTATYTLSGSPPAYAMNGTPGNKGNSAGVHTAMDGIMDKPVIMPVYSTYSGNGSNATYTVTGFITVMMCGYDKTTKGSCYDSAVPMTGDDMQVKFVSYSTAGELGTVAGLGDSDAFDSYVTGLIQ